MSFTGVEPKLVKQPKPNLCSFIDSIDDTH